MPSLRVWLVSIVLLAPTAGSANGASPYDAWFQANQNDLVALYTHLHTHPELSFQEVKTAERIADELTQAGAVVTTGVGKLGVVGILKNGPGPTVLIRTDLDALPVAEETGLPYASKATALDLSGKPVSVMHACGHDIHMTCLVGVARWLATHKDQWAGTVLLIGQPAEEMIGGAKAMLDDGLYTRFPKPDFALALHVTPDQATGTVAYTSGPALAGSTAVDVLIKGKGGHGASPHSTVDPIVLAALAIVDFQTIVSREINPIHPAVLTVGSIHGGTKHNIISNEVKLQLTLRAYRDDVRDQLIEGINRRVKGLAQAHQAPEPVVSLVETTPPTINTPSLVARILPVLIETLGAPNVKEVEPVMGAEDFGLYGRDGVPTFMFRLGTTPPQRIKEAKAKGESLPSLHSSLYHPDPAPSIQTGIRAMTAAALELMPAKP
ncbi:hippurate hydrolase [Singulisphaera sp. GP187]|uniref:M20 metallopeptidase family protein n=1 Tax=Singulisphaera sp. GP187 TaxID=1882752 RepID=UPI00092C39FC|nr:amidohydrolase [Singulisphaera sp. GP187]SIO66049.1 hippurate hydrolase [Singulisphaera sp. GP187]